MTPACPPIEAFSEEDIASMLAVIQHFAPLAPINPYPKDIQALAEQACATQSIFPVDAFISVIVHRHSFYSLFPMNLRPTATP